MNMDSKKRRIRETTPEHEEHVNPPKKRKIDSIMLGVENMNALLLEVKNKDLVKLKDLVNNGADVMSTGHILWNSITFEDIPALFAAIISDQEPMIDFLVGKYSQLKKEINCFILLDTKKIEDHNDLVKMIDVLELVGAACIFHGDTGARKQGWTCWNKAMKFREEQGLPKCKLHLSEFGKLALRRKTEIVNSKELEALLKQRRVHWKTQAFLVSHRILTKYGCFPYRFTVNHLYKFALTGWEKRKLDRSRVFVISLYLLELFETPSYVELTKKDKPEHSLIVIKSTLAELHKVLKDRTWTKKTLREENNVLTFDYLMIALKFSCDHQLKFHKSWPDEPTKQQHLDLISDLIHCILKLLMLVPQEQMDSIRLKECLETYIINYENELAIKKPNLLVRECTMLQMRHDTDFGLIKLLLGSGANPNSVDNQRRSPLHLLATKESAMSFQWTHRDYSTHVKSFTAIVREFLNYGHHDDQVDLNRKTAFECFNQYSHSKQYPDPQVHQLLGNYLQGVRPLSCLAAKFVKSHHLPCQDLPDSLQLVVLQH